MVRTINVHLKLTLEQAKILTQTMREHTACFNAVTQLALPRSAARALQKQTYDDLRGQFPNLPAQLVCASRVKATEAVTSALDRLKKGRKTRVPQSKSCPIRYDKRSFWVKWETMTCSLATVQGRLEFTFSVPTYAQKDIGGKVCSADLCVRKGRYMLHIVVSISDPPLAPPGTMIGADLGLNRPDVTSNRHFLGERRWKEQERRLFRMRRTLQKNGSHSARRHLKKLSSKLLRQRRDHDHMLSKRLVQHAALGSTIVIENLTHIRLRMKLQKRTDTKRCFHRWSFAQFHAFLVYKAQERGIAVVKFDPRHTSQTCSRCSYHHCSQRRSQSLFKCRACGYTLNASLNSREKHARLGRPLASGLPSRTLSFPPSDEAQAPGFSLWGI